MARHASLLLLAVVVVLASAVASPAAAAAAGGGAADADWARRAKSCQGTVAECLGEAGEFDAAGGDALLRRRRLDDFSGYISYGALTADSVPCSIPGASYYNCQPGANANPYTRGCSAITQCRD